MANKTDAWTAARDRGVPAGGAITCTTLQAWAAGP